MNSNSVVGLVLVVLIKLIYEVQSLSECPKLKNLRLSRNVRPDHYDLSMHLDFEALTTNGTVVIFVRLNNETDEITVHSKDLQISSARFISYGVEHTSEVSYCSEDETATFHFGKSIGVSGKLEIHFTGNLSTNRASGIYAMKTLNGSQYRYSVATQFQPADARRAFPCFDEPGFKSTFSIKIIAPSDRTILSNMPAIKKKPISQKEVEVTFSETPRMSTYLVCIVVGDFDFVEQQSKDGRVQVRVYTPIGRANAGRFALDVSIKSLDFLQNFLGIEYPLPKMDLIGVKDFYAGAMENWGLIVFKEMLLLVDEETPIAIRQMVASVTIHEITHQWFGNLVTLEWWTHTWLNEGFATFFQWFLTDILFKEWNYWSLFASSSYSSALEFDSLHSTHPLHINSVDVDEVIEQAFDVIEYNKGGSVIRMFMELIGEEKFKKALNNYLHKHKYGNTVSNNLINAIGAVSNKSVKCAMRGWVRQMGYPLLNVVINDCKRNVSKLEQMKFSSDGKILEGEENIWKIPVRYSLPKYAGNGTFIMETEVKTLSKCVFYWNDRSVGFYRPQCADEKYDILFTDVGSGKVHAYHRFALHNDYFAFAKAGREDIVKYLEYLRNYENENELFVWQSIESSLSQISLMISENKSCSKNMRKYVQRLFANVRGKLETEEKGDLETLLQVLVYRKFGLLGDERIVSDARQQFDDYYNEGKTLNRDFRSAIFQIVASNATDDDFDKLFELYKRNANDANKRNELAKAMGSSGNQEQIRRALKFSLSSDVTLEDCLTIITTVGGSPNGIAFDFFAEHFDFYKARYNRVAGLITGIVSSLNSDDKANEVESFFKANKFERVKSALRSSLEGIRNRINWNRRDAQKICDYLNSSG